jgi:hypothetical protein
MVRMKKHELAEKISDLVLSVLDDSPIERSRTFLPVLSRTIRPHTFEAVVIRAQVPFRGDRLAVWSKTAAAFFIEDIRVGCRSLSAAVGSTPADAFATRLDLLPLLDQQLDQHGLVQVRVSRKAEDCFGQLLAFPLAPLGTDITVNVTNVTDEPAIFAAVILGDIEN